MAASSKRNSAYHGITDVISDLPENLLDCILDRLPLKDVARTSILSRKWRYVWALHSQVVLDLDFFMQIMARKPFSQQEFMSTVTKILLLHKGPIRKFFLQIPNIVLDPDLDIGQWLLFLSRNGSNDLLVDNSSPNTYELPSYVFACQELRMLRLRKFIIKPTHKFGVFHNLTHCLFGRILFGAGLFGGLVLDAILLKSLTFKYCNGINHFNINAPKLRMLNVIASDQNYLMYCKSILNLTNVAILLWEEVNNPRHIETIDLVKVLTHNPRAMALHFDGYFLKAAGTLPKRLPIRVKNLAKLALSDFKINDVDQISCAFWLLRSFPNLRHFTVDVPQTIGVTDMSLQPALDYLEAPGCMYQILNQLQTIRLRLIKGSRAELLLVKILLACSPWLEKMLVDLNSIVDYRKRFGILSELIRFRILSELMRFSRASSKSEVVLGTVNVVKDLFLETKLDW